MSSYSITINNGPDLDAEAHLIEVLSITHHNLAQGSAQLMIRRKPSEAPLIASGDWVAILRDGEVIFAGPASDPVKSCTGHDYGHMHLIRDPWFILENDFWRKLGDLPTQLAMTTSAYLLWRDFIRSRHAGYLQVPDTWPSSLPNTWWNQWPLATAPSIVGLRRLFSHLWQAGARWDYGTTPPTLSMVNQGEDLVTLDAAQHDVQSVSLSLPLERQPANVELTGSIDSYPYLGDMYDISRIFAVYDDTTLWPPGAVPGAFGSVTSPAMELEFENLAMYPAKCVYELLSAVHYEGSIVVAEKPGQTLSFRPGQTINLGGSADYDPAWASMATLVQEAAYDAFDGVWRLRLGSAVSPTAHTALEALHDMMRVRPWNYMNPQLWPFGSPAAAKLGAGSGVGARCDIIPNTDVSGMIELVTGSTGLSGSTLATITWANPMSLSVNVTLTPSNLAAVALGATALVTSGQSFDIIASGATPGTAYEWVFGATPA